jgi:hypothetical protein
MAEEVGVPPQFVRPKKPKKIASSAAKFIRYKILKKYTTDAGRHFMFIQVLVDNPDRPIQHLINIEPYKGQAWSHPGEFYRMLKDKGFTMRRVSRSQPPTDTMIKNLLGIEDEPPQPPEPPPVKEPRETQGYLFDMSSHPDSADWRGGGWLGEFIKSADSVWTQDQVYCEDGSCYDVEKLINEVKGNSVTRVKVADLASQLEENAWGDDSVYVSPMGVMREPLLNINHKVHMRRIQTANMEHPLLIRFTDGKLIDGYHRLARAYRSNTKYVDVIYIQEEQFEKGKIKS